MIRGPVSRPSRARFRAFFTWATRSPAGSGRMALGVVAMLAALGCWAVASPVGSSPDEDFHIISIWCSHGVREGVCEPGPTADTRTISAKLVGYTCYAFQPEVSAACQATVTVGTGMGATERGNFTGLYPPVFYWVMGIFAFDNIQASVLIMRGLNTLLFAGLMMALYLLVPPGLKRPLVGGILVTAVPMAMFIIPSINPSSWGLTSAATATVATLAYLRAETRRRQLQLGALVVVSVLIGAGARADAAIYTVIAAVAAVILTFRLEKRYLTRLILPGVLAVIAAIAYLSTGQSSLNLAGQSVPQDSLTFNRLVEIVLDVPALWIGGLGGSGLGWLDTAMRPAVWVSTSAVFAGMVFLAVGGARLRRGLALGVVGAAAIVIPTYVQFLTGHRVGEIVQPRYILPLLTLLAVTAMVRVDATAFRLTNAQRWIIVGLLSYANAVALFLNLRRYVTGTDVIAPNLDHGVEWWWPGPLSPMAVLVIGALAFAVGAVLLTKDFTVVMAATGDDSPSSTVDFLTSAQRGGSELSAWTEPASVEDPLPGHRVVEDGQDDRGAQLGQHVGQA